MKNPVRFAQVRPYLSAIVVTALLALIVQCSAVAQAVYGTLIGTVTDTTGAAVPGATISVTNVGTNFALTAQTNASGEYTLSNLIPGSYKITVTKTGFKTWTQENVPIGVGRSTTVNATVELGQITEHVTVTSSPPTIETDRPGVSTEITASDIERLPVLNRNFTSFELLVPGSTINNFQHAQTENPQSGLQIDTNGQSFDTTNFLLDGMDNTDPVLGIIMVNPPIDSVQEFNFTTSNFSAEFAQAGGGVIQLQTKSGTNALHGSAFEFLRNDVFQARDPFTQTNGVPPLRWNQFGGSLGGPILKTKLFFFGDYQGTRQRNGGSVLTFVPTAAERAGDLSAFGTAIYDPTTGGPDGSGRTQFSDPSRATPSNPSGMNIIPAGDILPQASALLALLPMPNLTPADPAAPNYTASGVQIYDTNQFDVRADFDPSESWRFFGRYSYGAYYVNTPGAFQTEGGPQFNGFQFEGISHGLNQNAVGGATWVVSPSFVGDFRAGYTRYRVRVTAPDESAQLATQLGIPGLNFPDRPDTWGLPDLNIGTAGGNSTTGSFQTGYVCNCPLHETEQEYQGTTDWTKYIGNHSIKFGADLRRRQNLRLPSDQHRAGVYNFESNVTASAVNPDSGLALASFLLGDPSTFNRFSQVSTNQQDVQWSMYYYISDSWRATHKLTLTYGLRWDTWFADESLNAGQGGRYDVTTNTVYIPGVGGVSMSGNVNTDFKNFSPRIGIAYAFNDRTVLRTGWGRSYFEGNFGWNFNDLDADIYPSIVSQNLTAPSSFFPVEFTAGAPISAPSFNTAPPVPVFPAIPASGRFPLPDGISTPNIPTYNQIPYVDSWNLTVERELFTNATLSVGYVGNVGRYLNGGWNLNAPMPGPGPNEPRQPLFLKFGLTQDIFNKCNCENNNYNALQVKFNKHFSSNYSLLASFTWARAMDFGEWGTSTNQYDYHMDYGPASFDRRLVFTLSHVVRLPFGRGERWYSNPDKIADLAISGWEFTGITTAETGMVFSPTISASTLNTFDMGLRPDQIGDPNSGTCVDGSPVHTRDCWFNNTLGTVWAVPALYTFGDARRDSLYGPGFVEMDWGLHKTFSLTERFKLQFRWDVFNALNIVNLGNPSGDVTAGSTGATISSTILATAPQATMRNMQFALRLTW
ncbi:MAG TPA: carboxypeptidase regulatory-like domain-containing protein [Candidatus Acidoferrales bacterium]|nr:carboxypeptidase regulatory-like domain-containing protein [Candidatus Acidoferrales bacterium]